MADDKNGREDQAADQRQRQREREIREELRRADEPEPPVDTSELAFFETELDELSFPATGRDVVEAVGDRKLESIPGRYTVEDLVPNTAAETYESPAAVRTRVQRPTVAGAMKQIVEAADRLRNTELQRSQREGYEKTFLALKSIDADDEDEGIRAIREWVLEQISEEDTLPGSRAVRRQAAQFCRSQGYEVSDNDWLGI